jgi:hypothetical protein
MAGPSDRTHRWLGTLGDPDALTHQLAASTIKLTALRGDPAAEIALAMAATMLLRLDKAAPAVAVAVPGTRAVALPRLHDGDLVDALAVEHAGFSSVARLHRFLCLSGAPLAVDADRLDDTNLNRQIIAGFRELGEFKPDLVAAVLNAAGARTHHFACPWDRVDLEIRRACEIGLIAVDHDPTRRAVQLDLPRLLLNAGNADTGLYRVTRHEFLDGACLACVSHGDERSTGPEDSAAQRLGIPRVELQMHLDANVPLPEEVLAITDEEREHLRGKRARVALGIVCGEFSPAPDQPALSTPTLSAAPGVLLAAELVKERLGGAPSLSRERNHLSASVLGGPHARWSTWRGKRPGCACGDEVYRDFYARRWLAPA